MSAGFEALAAEVGEAGAGRLEAHWQLVAAANRTTNLTGVREASEAIELHYRDALAALPLWPQGASLLDVGAGAGFPGLVLACVRPQATVRLLEPRRLRVAFLRHAIVSLRLDNVTVLAGTLGGHAPAASDCLTMRAVFSRDAQLDACVSWMAPGGRLMVFRSGAPSAASTPSLLTRVARQGYAVGEPPRQRHIDVWQRRTDPAPSRTRR